MQFLRTIFWVLIATVAAIFSYNNWIKTDITLWTGLGITTPLPVLLLAAFLLGLLPYFILHRTTRWSLKRKLETAERALAETRVASSGASAPKGTIPPGAAPIAVPPGV
jgi:lipopolysaccharide assembly protein A